MDRDGGNKTQRIYRCGSNYALSKLILNNGLEDLWRREDPDSSERSSGTRSRTVRVYTDIKAANNFKINHIMASFTDYYTAIYLDRILSETKFGRELWYFNNYFLCKLEFSSITKNLLFLLKSKKNNSLTSSWW